MPGKNSIRRQQHAQELLPRFENAEFTGISWDKSRKRWANNNSLNSNVPDFLRFFRILNKYS